MLYVLFALLFFTIFLFGAAIFSFSGVIICRVPEGKQFVTGRSECSECGHVLASWQLIPVISYILLGGKCAYCKCHLSFSYLLSELAGGVIAVISAVYYAPAFFDEPFTALRALMFFAYVTVLYIITAVDAKTQEIPNGFVIALAVVAVVSFFVFPEILWYERLIGIFAASLPLLIITLIVPGAFGGGDIKLMAAVGLMCGWKLCLLSLFLAIISGGVYAIILLIRKKVTKSSHFAFGPFLCVGSALSFMFGDTILTAYLSLF